MALFKDKFGREWGVEFTHGNLPRLRQAGLNLSLAVRDPKQFDALDDPDTFGRVLWLLCGDQAEKAGVSPESFRDGFNGPAVFAAMDAISEALADFSQRPAVAARVREMLPGAMARLEQAQVRELESRLESLSLTGSKSGGGNSPASPDSTPPG